MPGVKNKTLFNIIISLTVVLVLYETVALLLVGEPEELPSDYFQSFSSRLSSPRDSLFRLILDTLSTGEMAWAGEKKISERF